MKYMEATQAIIDWCLAQAEPFSFGALQHGVEDIVANCDCSRQDVVIRAFSKARSTEQVILVAQKGEPQKYFSAEKWEQKQNEKQDEPTNE